MDDFVPQARAPTAPRAGRAAVKKQPAYVDFSDEEED